MNAARDPAAERVFIAVGANVGDRRRTVAAALRMIDRRARVVRISPFFETEPADGAAGGPFLNGAVEVRTAEEPEAFLKALAEIESALGRPPVRPRNQARTMDLDIVLWGGRVVSPGPPEIPHPRFRRRLFVLEPLRAIAPDAVDPATGLTIFALCEEARRAR